MAKKGGRKAALLHFGKAGWQGIVVVAPYSENLYLMSVRLLFILAKVGKICYSFQKERKMADESHIKIGKRVKKSKACPFGWEYAEQIPPDEVCLVALPGSDADNSKKANGFAKMVEAFLKNKKIPIYSVEYDLAGRISVADRMAMLMHFNQGNPNASELRFRREDYSYIPQYIRELYRKTFAPRLRDENGNRVSVARAAQRLNMMVFVNHCQGSTVSFQLERLLKKDMRGLGYSDKVCDYLLRQVHNADVAPVIPFGLTKTTTFKFISFADDKVTSVDTPQTRYVRERRSEHEQFLADIARHAHEGRKSFAMNFALFRPTGNETVFAVNNIYPLEMQKDEDLEGIEHVFDSYSEKDDDNRTKQGDQLSQAFREVVNWLAENAVKNGKELTELPDIAKEPRFSRLIDRAMANRYDFVTREAALQKSRRGTARALTFLRNRKPGR